MSIEVMELALEALKFVNQTGDTQTFDMCYADKAITALEEALAKPEQNPVAWIHNFIDGGISIGKQPADLNRHPDRWTALYKEPKPCPTCEALARTVMLDQTSHDTAPPQRKPLTDEAIATVYWGATGQSLRPQDNVLAHKFARAIEAAHNIKE